MGYAGEVIYCEKHGTNYINGRFGPFHKNPDGSSCKPHNPNRQPYNGGGAPQAQHQAASTTGGNIRQMFDEKAINIAKSVALQQAVALVSATKITDSQKALSDVTFAYAYFLKLLNGNTDKEATTQE